MAKVLAALAAALLIAWCSREVQCQEAVEVRESLVAFLRELTGGDEQVVRDLRWDASVQPCDVRAHWINVTCDGGDGRVRIIQLQEQGGRLNGTINATLLCAASTVRVVSLHDNALRGGIPSSIAACKGLTHLYLSGNQLSGGLPPELAQFRDLHVIDVSRNNFSGELPGELSRLKLKRFLANDNHFTGRIPDFNFNGVENFSVSNNNLTGPIPKNVGNFSTNSSWWPNAAGICGQPVFAPCQSFPAPSVAPPPSSSDAETEEREGQSKSTSKKRSARKIAMYIGFALLGGVVLALVLYLCLRKRRNRSERKFKLGGGMRVSDSSRATTTPTTPASASKSVYSMPTSVEQSPAAAGTPAPSTSMVVLRRSGTASITTAAAAAAAKEMRFEDLLKSPAELLGRGRFGSSYKVVVPSGAALVVKRVKDGVVNEDEFRRRMERVGRAKHHAVLPPLAFYRAMQEKLVVYEFQSNGSLSRLLHGSIERSHGPIDWPTRLHIAARVAEGMAFMHNVLRGDGASTINSSSLSSEEAAAADGPIAHGSLKTTNIIFTNGMDPCISEYGVTAPLLPAANSAGVSGSAAAFQADVRAFGVVLLELLTGKATAAQGDGAELARWVAAVIREEWTGEVFDRALLDGSSEQSMVRLLQVAMRCVDASPGAAAPPTMREVSSMINAIREDDDRSLSSEA